jgi:hypothetical protein
MNSQGNNCQLCYFSSIFSVFFYNFDWIFFGFSLHNLLTMINNPHKEMNFDIRKRWYFIIAMIVAGMFAFIMVSGDIYGVSVKFTLIQPMLTCFLRHQISEPSQYISMASLLLVPIVYSIYYVYAFVCILRKYRVQSNKEFKTLIVEYLVYSLIYMIFYFPIIILYLLTLNRDITGSKPLRWFAYVSKG